MQKILHGSSEFKSNFKSKNPEQLVLALGNFDGVHLAHQELIKQAVACAKKIQGKCYVYTFEPHPVKVLSKIAAPLMINTLDQKNALLLRLGVDGIILEKFDSQLAKMSAQDWFQKIVVQRLAANAIFTGYDFTFGYRRSGTVDTLQQLCQNHSIAFHMLSAQLFKKTLISSTQIRHFLEKGEITLANELLAYPFFIEGEVIQGMGRGQQLGIPTANLKTNNELIPPRGVYICRAVYQNKSFDAVTNIGINPTFGGQTLSIETHLLNFSQDIYQQKIRLHFYKKLRDEISFASVQDLTTQIAKDIKAAKAYLQATQKFDMDIDSLIK
ncbi:MAG: bifunctional riboflavin kinase/FAD synthetase [Deltaproteobacteria bacterium]|nr:bifunctional riboflavin kinase/FAD synthetase [Deltaproteobacteria bacterium]